MLKLTVAQRAMERSVLGISIVNRIPNIEIRRKTKVDDVGKRITRLRGDGPDIWLDEKTENVTKRSPYGGH